MSTDSSSGSDVSSPVISTIGPIFCTRGMVVFGEGPTGTIPVSSFRQAKNPSTIVVKQPLGFQGMYMRAIWVVVTAAGPVPFAGRVQASRPQDVMLVGGVDGDLKSVQCPGGSLVTGLHGQIGSAGVGSIGLYCSRIDSLD
jgi:hypothetical protein